jgi:bifunctional DNA-binding transcriptional regulator/antitoxin component of YhaV-PrlF toxin-antitoxin module
MVFQASCIEMGSKSTVTKAGKNSSSVRATIPEEVAKEMGLAAGDVLDWKVEERKREIGSRRKVVIVKKLE